MTVLPIYSIQDSTLKQENLENVYKMKWSFNQQNIFKATTQQKNIHLIKP